MAKKKRVNTEQVRIQNAAKSLVANIRFASIDKQVRSLVVTSSVPNEGKTTVAIALAQAMASLGERVLLVECDMRRRSLANLLGANSHYGLYSVVCGEADLEDAVATTSTRGLHFLDVEPHIPNPEAVLNSKRFAAFCERAAASYRYVIFDTPPLTAFVDAAVLSTVVDGTLLVVGENIVRRDELVEAYAQLQKAGTNVLGAVSNMCCGTDSNYVSRYYEESGVAVQRGSDLPDEPLAQRDEVRPAPSTRTTPAASQAGDAARAAVLVQPVQPVQPVRPVCSQGPAKGNISPDSTAQFMIGRYGTDAAQREAK